MTTLNIVIVVIATLVALTFVWGMRSARNAPPPLPPRYRDELQRRREQRRH